MGIDGCRVGHVYGRSEGESDGDSDGGDLLIGGVWAFFFKSIRRYPGRGVFSSREAGGVVTARELWVLGVVSVERAVGAE